MKRMALALFPLLLCACGGAPFTVAEETAMQPVEASEAQAPPDVVAVAPDVPDAGSPNVLPITADASPDVPDASPPPPVEASTPLEASVPPAVEASAPDASPVLAPGTLCCRDTGPSSSNGCFPAGALTDYPCGTVLGGWIYSVNTTDAEGMIHTADVDCTYGPPTLANLNAVCRWGTGTAPSVANCGAVGAIVVCEP